MEEERCFTGEEEVAQPKRRGGSMLGGEVAQWRSASLEKEGRFNLRGEVTQWRRGGALMERRGGST
jgi:hypothetical protein